MKNRLTSFFKISFILFFVCTYNTGFAKEAFQIKSTSYKAKNTKDWQWKNSAKNERENALLVNVKNTLPVKRMAQTIEVSWKAIIKRSKEVNVNNVVVIDMISGNQIPSQVIYNEKKKPQTLIFQTDLAENSELLFSIKAGERANYESKVYGRKVPERFDDFAWENDKAAFRMYGAALDKQEKGNAKGLDVWSKKIPNLIVNKWYKTNNYHVDQGEGMDAYHVGMTLGAGSSAVYKDGKFAFSANYAEYKVIEHGPIRITFDLIYNSWDAKGQKVSQVKTVSLDAGSNINKITDHYRFKGRSLPIAAGITKHKNDGSIKIDHINNYVSYWDKADGKVDNGMIGVAVLFPANENVKLVDESDHLLGLKALNKNSSFTYYQGSAWNKSGFFNNETDWLKYLEIYSKGLKTPVLVKY